MYCGTLVSIMRHHLPSHEDNHHEVFQVDELPKVGILNVRYGC